MNKIEEVARALCTAEGYKPDALEPGDALGIDGYLRNGDPSHFLWREWAGKARLAIEAMRTPTEAMIEAGLDANPRGPKVWPDYKADDIFNAMIDAALQDTP